MISILSLVYNHEKYLDDFFEGILSQKSEEDFELIIGIDKSDDKSGEICLSYQRIYPGKIKIIAHEERVGMFNNFLSVYTQCKGEYIAICEGDDFWIDENKLQKQLKLLKENKNAVLCFTNIKVYDEEEGTYHENWASIEKVLYTVDDLIRGNPVSTCSVLFKNCFNSFSTSFSKLPMVDWPLYVHLLMDGNAIYLPDITAVYRSSSGSSYAKNSIVEQLIKKKNVYEYFILEKKFDSKKQLIDKVYHLNLYAIAIRLPKSDPRKEEFLKRVSWHSFKHANGKLLIKSILKRVI